MRFYVSVGFCSNRQIRSYTVDAYAAKIHVCYKTYSLKGTIYYKEQEV